MTWNWQKKKWPEFIYSSSALNAYEELFMFEAGKLLGAFSHVDENNQKELVVEFISEEAIKTSKIEGELLDRESLAISLRRNFGLIADGQRIPPRERGITEMMVDAYHHFDTPLTHETMFNWHRSLMQSHTHLKGIGNYRTHEDPMQVVSGRPGKWKIHYEAPPSSSVPKEMSAFVDWFNDSSPAGSNPLPALTRAGIAHLYFVSIHPFEDGNGRIGRALSEKALSQSLNQPALVALSHVIEGTKKEYYNQLEANQSGLAINPWLHYFSRTTLEAVNHSQRLTAFLIKKTKLYDRIHGQINARQAKVLDCMLKKGIEGWDGGMSAKKYMSISGAPIATTTRDLKQLVELGVFTKTGKLKTTRYWIPFQNPDYES